MAPSKFARNSDGTHTPFQESWIYLCSYIILHTDLPSFDLELSLPTMLDFFLLTAELSHVYAVSSHNQFSFQLPTLLTNPTRQLALLTPSSVYLSDGPRSLCVHGGIGSPGVGKLPWQLQRMWSSVFWSVQRLYFYTLQQRISIYLIHSNIYIDTMDSRVYTTHGLVFCLPFTMIGAHTQKPRRGGKDTLLKNWGPPAWLSYNTNL